ncbi:WD40-repeat-containing domain protein [Fimicolochytrium jonesii]|uniref:WD40-repeat-containing domain protein n=1 Tax=Fimicolochytrium jonesii TaxID=1396493 RepID=UPI0022FE4D7D|nr:WD40-repeat-containing domain protein [Fimicolochytrium jonesii]KAI8824431.1 WD40-repeat-containing domain protein [Fimicolochytrium jonesii]
MSEKRKADAGSALVATKKPRADNESGGLALATTGGRGGGAIIRKIKRTSDLQGPIMLLTGHQGEVFSCRFSPSGRNLVSGSFDRLIYLWEAHGECKNYGVLKGHAGPVLQVQWSSDGTKVYSASTDKTLGVWDAEVGERIKKLKGHTSYVNSCASTRREVGGTDLIVSGSDDGSAKVWDPRVKQAVHSFENKFAITSVEFNQDGGLVFAGGLDNKIRAWDMRKGEVAYTLAGHFDTVTGLRLSPDGDMLLSNSMDNTVRIWDVKPFAASGSRLTKILEGAPQGFEKNLLRPCWSPHSDFVAAGSGDRSVVVWDVSAQKIVYKLPGHKGVCNEVDWTHSIIASASNDKTLFIGELNVDEVK